MAKVAANEGKLRFFGINIFNPAYPFHGFLMMDVAAKAVNGIGRVNNDTTIFDTFSNLLKQAWLWVIGM